MLFEKKEFRFCKNSFHDLCKAISDAKYPIKLASPNPSLEMLNELLMSPQFYDAWSTTIKSTALRDQIVLKPEIKKLIDLLKGHRADSEVVDKFFEASVILLNRYLLEATYTKLCPTLFAHTVWEWVDSIVIALILAAFIRTYFVQPFKIPSGSMRMTLIEGDRLFFNKLRYGPKVLPEFLAVRFRDQVHVPEWLAKARFPGLSKPKRGDIIVFVFPEDRKRDFIKRLIAFGGETVEIKNGKIYINDTVVDEPRIRNFYYYNYGPYGEKGIKTVVPQGYYFALGDNSNSSHDSRYWGFIPEDYVIGRAEFIFWPLSRVRTLK